MIGIIAAVSSNGVIGTPDNKLPFNDPDDKRFFKYKTENNTVIMGRKTFESIGKPLPKRNNIVITSSIIPGTKTFTSIKQAFDKEQLYNSSDDIWFIGGHSIYQEAMLYVSEIYLTVFPIYINEKDCVKFPWINPLQFELSSSENLSSNRLNNSRICKYKVTEEFDVLRDFF